MSRGIELPKEVMKGSEQAKIPERTMWFVCFCSLQLNWKVQRDGHGENSKPAEKEGHRGGNSEFDQLDYVALKKIMMVSWSRVILLTGPIILDQGLHLALDIIEKTISPFILSQN